MVTWVGWLIGCAPQDSTIEQYTGRWADHPDSLLAALDEMDTTGFDTAQLAKYVLVKVQAKDMAGLDIQNDTAIFAARDFLVKTGDHEDAASACFYSGKVYYLQEEYQQAISNFMNARGFARTIADEKLKAHIVYYMGVANYAMGEYNEALPYLEEAPGRYHKAGKLSHEAHANITLGSVYFVTDNPGRALAVYGRAMQYAEKNNDTDIEALFFHGLGAYMHEVENHTLAETWYRKAIRQSTNERNRARLQANLVGILFASGQMDSAIHYAEMAGKTLEMYDDQHALLELYELTAKINAKINNYQDFEAGMSNYDSCLNVIYQERETQNILEVQKIYQVEELQNKRIAEQKKHIIVGGCMALGIILLAGIAIYLVLKNKTRKKANTSLLRKINSLQVMRDEAVLQKNRLEEAVKAKTEELDALKAKLNEAPETGMAEQDDRENAINEAVMEKMAELGILENELNGTLANIIQLEQDSKELQKEKARADRLTQKVDTRNSEISAMISHSIMTHWRMKEFHQGVTKSQDHSLNEKSMVEKELMVKLNREIYGKDEADHWAVILKTLPRKTVKKLNKIANANKLSPNETKVLYLYYLNVTPSGIAVFMGVRPDTVYEYNSKLREKLKLSPDIKISDYLNSIL